MNPITDMAHAERQAHAECIQIEVAIERLRGDGDLNLAVAWLELVLVDRKASRARYAEGRRQSTQNGNRQGGQAMNEPPIGDWDALRLVNVRRLRRWHDGDAGWTGADWSNAMCGEAGEAANIVKKIRRHETGLGTSYNTPERHELDAKLAQELADVIIYADLLAHHYGIDLGAAIVEKFNQVSENQGFPERLDRPPFTDAPMTCPGADLAAATALITRLRAVVEVATIATTPGNDPYGRYARAAGRCSS